MRKLAIVGSEPKTRGDAPWDDPAYEIWVFNEAAQNDTWCKRWDVLFQMHKSEIYSSPYNLSNSNHWPWLQEKHGKPIYMIDVDPRVPDSVRYPLEEIQAMVPVPVRDFYDLSAVYALLLGVLKGYEEIHIWGMDLVSNTEYIYQADCWRAWIMWAWGCGVNVVMHCNEGLFSHRKYGYDGEVQLKPEFFIQREQSYGGSWAAAEKNYTNCKKALERAISNKDYARIVELIDACKSSARMAGEYAGRESLAKSYVEAGDRPIYRNDFEKRAAVFNRDGETHNNSTLVSLGKVEYVFNVFKQTQGNPQAAVQLHAFIGEMLQHAYDLGAHLGGFQEVMEYIHELDELIQAYGGRKSVQVVSMQALESIKPALAAIPGEPA